MTTIVSQQLTNFAAAFGLTPFLSTIERGELASRFVELGWTDEHALCPQPAAPAVLGLLQRTIHEFEQHQQIQQQQLQQQALTPPSSSQQQQQQQQMQPSQFVLEAVAGKGLGGVGGGLGGVGGDIGGGKGKKGKKGKGGKGEDFAEGDNFKVGDDGMVSITDVWEAAKRIEIAGVSAEMARVLAAFIDPTKKGVPGANLREQLERDLRDARQPADPEPKQVVAWIHQHMKEELTDEKMPIEVKAARLTRVLSALPPVPPNVGELGGAITALDAMTI